MRRLGYAAALMGLVLSGCGTTGTPEFMHTPKADLYGVVDDAMEEARLEKAISDGRIAMPLDTKVQPKLPTVLAVAKLLRLYGFARVAALERGELRAWERVVAADPLIRGIQPLAPPAPKPGRHYPEKANLRELRAGAVRHSCDLLLVYLQADAHAKGPGIMLHHTVMQAILVDAATGTILGVAAGDSRLNSKRWPVFTSLQRGELFKEGKEEGLKQLQEGCRKLVSEVVGAAQASR